MEKKRWKIAFLALALINLIVVLIFSYLIFSPGKKGSIPKSNLNKDQYVEFKINTNKADLNKLINHYIEKEGLNGPVDYSVYLQDEVELYGTIQIFSQDLQLKMTFEPKALENGDLMLKQKSISLGDLKLPVSYVLKFIEKSYKLPEWVSIQPTDKLIYVSLQRMNLNSGMKVQADKFNLNDDDISFTLLFPTE